jgi:2,4-dienoyl-CoA reductase-like NADH-dependent reductase (Old Yellow Enzyme family)
MVRSGAADLACFGRLYISNHDLPERLANNWPTALEATYETWWVPTGAKGYTDFPIYENLHKFTFKLQLRGKWSGEDEVARAEECGT